MGGRISHGLKTHPLGLSEKNLQYLADKNQQYHDNVFVSNWLQRALSPGEYARIKELPLPLLRDLYAPIYECGPQVRDWLTDLTNIHTVLTRQHGRQLTLMNEVSPRLIALTQIFERHGFSGNADAMELKYAAVHQLSPLASRPWYELQTLPVELAGLATFDYHPHSGGNHQLSVLPIALLTHVHLLADRLGNYPVYAKMWLELPQLSAEIAVLAR